MMNNDTPSRIHEYIKFFEVNEMGINPAGLSTDSLAS